jgi:hypothetical protein
MEERDLDVKECGVEGLIQRDEEMRTAGLKWGVEGLYPTIPKRQEPVRRDSRGVGEPLQMGAARSDCKNRRGRQRTPGLGTYFKASFHPPVISDDDKDLVTRKDKFYSIPFHEEFIVSSIIFY